MPFCASRQLRAMKTLAIRLLRKANVSVHPGHFYDFPN